TWLVFVSMSFPAPSGSQRLLSVLMETVPAASWPAITSPDMGSPFRDSIRREDRRPRGPGVTPRRLRAPMIAVDVAIVNPMESACILRAARVMSGTLLLDDIADVLPEIAGSLL